MPLTTQEKIVRQWFVNGREDVHANQVPPERKSRAAELNRRLAERLANSRKGRPYCGR